MNCYERVVANIDLDAIRTNVENLKANTAPGTLFCGVVKADGYGHGAAQVAKHCADLFDWLAVATVEEAYALRRQGLSHPILVLGFVPKCCYKALAASEIRPTVYELSQAKELSKAAVEAGKMIKIHLKLDTGMNRLGFLCSEKSVEEILTIGNLPGLVAEGIFTHFVSADEADKTRSHAQRALFLQMVEALEKKGLKIPIRHVSNSAGIIDLQEANESMVRAGIAIYGLYPSGEVNRQNTKLIPALELKSRIVYLRMVSAGEGISYGATYVTGRKTRVATIPVGYGDGYPRALSNKGYVLINGKQAPILGRICMDQFMVDVTDIPGVEEGMPVTLIGTDKGNRISPEELSELSGGFHYELICGLSKRIPRRYFQNGRIVAEKDYFQ